MHTAADLRAVLSFAERTLTVNDFSQVPLVLLAGLTELVGCDAVTLTHLDLQSQREVAVFWPPSRGRSEALERYPRVGASHPLRGPVGQQLRTGCAPLPPVRVSDVMSRRQWRETELYRESHRGIDDQMCLVLCARGSVVHAVTLTRYTGSFSERQRDVLAGCRGHLAAAVARAERRGHVGLQIAPALAWVALSAAPGVAPQVVTPLELRRTTDPAAGSLSAREREVVALVAAGLTDAQVARRLQLRPATVSSHLRRIYARLDLPNRAALARYWSACSPTAS